MLLLLLPQLLLLSLASMVWMWRGEATTPAWPADHTEMLKSRFFLLKGIVNPLKSLSCTVRGLEPVVRIHDILVWIRIRGSMPLTNAWE